MIQRESDLLCDETSLVLKVLDMVGDTVYCKNVYPLITRTSEQKKGISSSEKEEMMLQAVAHYLKRTVRALSHVV